MKKSELRQLIKEEIQKVVNEKFNIPKGWKVFKSEDDQDPEEDIEVVSYGAPMEGWDKDNYDFVNIMKTPNVDAMTDKPLKSKYYIQTYTAFGDLDESEMFNSFKEAKMEAINIMNKIKNDWN